MIILGIDPALASLGWGAIEIRGNAKPLYVAGGLIKTFPEEKLHLRLAFIVKKLEEIIGLYNPALVSMEETFVNKNAVTSLKLGYVRGAIMALAGLKSLELKEFKPNFVKKALVGAGHAGKDSVLSSLKFVLSGLPERIKYDEADALAAAYCAWAKKDF